MPDFTSEPFIFTPTLGAARRVDVELHQVDQAVPSYEGRLFLDNQHADRETARTAEEGYLGSYFVFGKVECWGEDEGHCHPRSNRKFDRRRPPGRHMKVRVTVPPQRVVALAQRAARAGGQVTLSVVAVQTSGDAESRSDVLRFGRLSLIAYA